MDKKLRHRSLYIDEMPCLLIIMVETQGKVRGKLGMEEWYDRL